MADEQGYDAGEAFLRIIPSFAGVQTAIDREAAKWGLSAGRAFGDSFSREARQRTSSTPLGPSDQQSRQQGGNSGRSFADTFKARVAEALRSLPDARVGADLTEADRQLAELRERLEALRDARVGVDLDAGAALAELAAVRAELDRIGRESPDVSVRVDTARAEASLAEVQAEIDRINGETARASVEVSDGGSASSVAGDLVSLQSVLIGLAPAAIPVGAALIGGLAGVGAALGAAAAGAGVLALGLSGVSGASKLLDQRQAAMAAQVTKAGASSRQAATQEANAATQITSAQQSLADARRQAGQSAHDAAERVRNANRAEADSERSLADAQRQAAQQRIQADEQLRAAEYSYAQSVQQTQQAEQALRDARAQAKRDLQSSADAQADAVLAQQQAVLDLETAQANNTRVQGLSTATDQQKAQALLDLQKAQQALLEAQQQATNATVDNTKAQKAGVDGAPGVVDAGRQVAQSKHDQATAAQALTDAERASAQTQRAAAESIAKAQEGVRKAQQGVRDAVRDQARQQQASAEAIVRAQAQVASAMRNAAAASDSAGTSGVSALSGIDAQLAKVNPATLAFAKFLHGSVQPAFDRLKATGARNLLPGLTDALKDLRPLEPLMNRFVGSVSRALGGLATQAARAFNSPFWKQFFGFVNREAGPTLTTLGRVIGNFAKGFAGLFEAFGPTINSVGRGVLALSRSFANFGANARHSAAFQQFLGYIRRSGPVVVDVLRNVAEIAGKLIKGLAPLGLVLLRGIDAVAKFLAKLSPNQLLAGIGGIAGAIAAIVFAIGGPATGLAAVATAAAVALVAAAALIINHWKQIKPALQPLIDSVREFAGFLIHDFAPAAAKALLAIWNAVKGPLHALGEALQSHKAQFKQVGEVITKYLLPVLGFLVGRALASMINVITDVVKVIGTLIGWIDDLIDVGKDVIGFFSGPFVDAFTTAWSNVQDAFSSALSWVAGKFQKAWGLVQTYIVGPIKAALKFVKGIWNNVRDVFTTVVGNLARNWAPKWAALKNTISAPIRDAKGLVSGLWNDIRNIFNDATSWLTHNFAPKWAAAKSVLEAPLRIARGVFHDIWGDIKAGARDFVADIGRIWAHLEGVFKAPIRFVVDTVLNDGLIAGWNWVADKVHFGHIKDIPLPFSTGGVVPGYAPGVDSVHTKLSPGEGVMVPEFVKAVGPATIHAWNRAAMAGRAGGQRFSGGGIVQHFAGGGIVGDLDPTRYVDYVRTKVEGPLHDFLDRFGGSRFGQMVSHVPKTILTDTLKVIRKKVEDIGGSLLSGLTGGTFGTGSGVHYAGHAQAIAGGLLAAGIPANTATMGAVNLIISNESGWNPTAVNRYDSNWQAGHPSVGLMQVIRGTFAEWVPQALRGRGPFAYGVSEDPIANIAAGSRYAVGRYGSLLGVPGVVAVSHGLPYVGYDHGGWLEPGAQMVYNGTGRRELVVPPSQTYQQIVGAGVGDVHVAVAIGNEAIDPRMVQITNVTLDKRFSGAKHAVDQQRVPLLAALSSPHARAVSRA